MPHNVEDHKGYMADNMLLLVDMQMAADMVVAERPARAVDNMAAAPDMLDENEKPQRDREPANRRHAPGNLALHTALLQKRAGGA